MSYKIPLFDLNFDEREVQAVADTVRSGWISLGPKCEELEKRFASMLNIEYACSISNCSTALHLAHRMAGVGEGDEVIVPALTFVATVNSIRYTGAIPVFCDIKSIDNLNIDAEKIESLITPKTKAITVMHFAGFPVDMKKVMEIAGKYNLKVIEDACHGPLSEYEGKKLGTIGDIGCFSFYSNKNISTGEGGMLVTHSKEIFDLSKLLYSHGMTSLSYSRAKGHTTAYDVVELGYNYRMDDIRASIGLVQLDKLQADLEKRAIVRKMYEEKLSDIPSVTVPFKQHKGFVSNYIFPIVLQNSDPHIRNQIREDLFQKGIQTSVHYPAVHRFSIYKPFAKPLPNTEYVADNIITLPMYSKLTEEQIVYIATALKEILHNNGL